MRKMTPTFIAMALLSTLVWAENWPNWRGPDRDGSSSETDLPLRWSATEGFVWKTEMPAWSGATPIVWGDTIFLNMAEGGQRQVQRRGRRRRPQQRTQPPPPQLPTTSFQTSQQGAQEPDAPADPSADKLALWALDRATGQIRWKRSLGGGNQQLRKQNMSSPSPVTDGRHVWAMTGTGIVKAFDFDGNAVWERDIQADYGEFGLNWGYASSPLLHDGTLYVQVLHGMKTDDPSYVLSLDAATGETKWRVERPTDAVRESPDSYTTPAVLQYDGKTEIVITGGDYVTGHDPATGRELWRAGGLNPRKSRSYRIVASPIVIDGLIIVPTRQNPLQVFRPGGELVWATETGPDVPTPVTDGQRLFIVRDNGVALCLNVRSGETIWGPERLKPGTYSASPVLADGRVYVTSEDGITTVFRAGDTFEVMAENELEGYTLSSPAISDGQIFIRTEKYLYAIGERR